jgi:hypothetical protein
VHIPLQYIMPTNTRSPDSVSVWGVWMSQNQLNASQALSRILGLNDWAPDSMLCREGKAVHADAGTPRDTGLAASATGTLARDPVWALTGGLWGPSLLGGQTPQGLPLTPADELGPPIQRQQGVVRPVSHQPGDRMLALRRGADVRHGGHRVGVQGGAGVGVAKGPSAWRG